MFVGQFLLADSAYALSTTCIPAYKAPAANIPVNTEFNYCIAKSRVRNEHTIGILKGRWALLQQLRLALHTPRDMRHIIRWVNACVTLHNMLAQLGDAWEEIQQDEGLNGPQPLSPATPSDRAENLRGIVQEKCIRLNYANGTLPIPL